MSSLGSRRVREEFKRPSWPGSQPTSRTGQRTCGRACTGVHARPHMLRLDGRLALARGLLRPSSELSGVGSRGADQLVGRKFERNAAEPGQRGRGWDRERRSRSESPSDGKAGRESFHDQSFHDQFRYSPERESLGSVLLRSSLTAQHLLVEPSGARIAKPPDTACSRHAFRAATVSRAP